MTKRGVEDASLPIHFAPRDRKIMVRTMNARIIFVIQLRRIETQQHIHLVARPVFWLVNLVVLHKFCWKMPDGRKIGGFVYDRRIESHPRMLVEPSANHLSIFRPGVIGVQRRMDSDKTLSIFFDKRHHVALLVGVHVSSPVVLAKTRTSK